MFLLGKAMKHRREYADLCDPEKPLDMKTIEKTVLRNFDSICLLLNKPEFKSQRQPNLLVTIPRLAQLLRDIWSRSEEQGDNLNGNTYWRTVLRTLAEQSWDLSCLVREHAKDIDKPCTQASQQYFQWSLSLFCIQLEMEAMFPNRRYASYKIGSSEAAADWWKRHFGRSDSVTWHDFQYALSKRFKIKSLAEANDLKQEVNITGSDHVSVYEFDVFARLFAPWGDQTVDLWRTIVKDHPAFVRLRFREVKSLLRGQRPFSYLFRRSTNTPAVWSIGYINEAGSVTQILVKPDKTIVEALTECMESGFLLFPAGKDACFAPSLEAFRQPTAEDLQVQKQRKRNSRLQKQKPEEIYVVAPELECSLCSQRSDEVTSMESCEHILCDVCFDRHVQPKLCEAYGDRGASGGSLKLFCPVCAGVGAASPPVDEVDLICLDDDIQTLAPVANTGGAAGSVSWMRGPLSDFDPILKPETPWADVDGVDRAGQSAELYDRPVKLSEKRLGNLAEKAAKDEYSLLASSTSQAPTAAAAATLEPQKPNGGYLFYGSEEDVRRLLSHVPGLKFVRLDESLLHQLGSSCTGDGLYSQIWDEKNN